MNYNSQKAAGTPARKTLIYLLKYGTNDDGAHATNAEQPAKQKLQ